MLAESLKITKERGTNAGLWIYLVLIHYNTNKINCIIWCCDFELHLSKQLCRYDFMPSGKSKKREQCKNTQIYPLSETQYCPCNKYNAQPVGNWSDCILPEGGRVEGLLGMKVQGDIKECGQGYRYQVMVCYDQDNRLVETSRCNSHGGLTDMWNLILLLCS